MDYYDTDPEFMERFDHFAFDEVVNEEGQQLEPETRYPAILAALITFCFLAAQGGCEPQLTAHAKGNMNIGNDRDFLIRVGSQCLPYIGYPPQSQCHRLYQ